MTSEHHLEPEACGGMEDIGREIDHIDRAVISVLGKRFQYVIAAAKFKKLYRDLVNYFIEEEMKRWQSPPGNA